MQQGPDVIQPITSNRLQKQIANTKKKNEKYKEVMLI